MTKLLTNSSYFVLRSLSRTCAYCSSTRKVYVLVNDLRAAIRRAPCILYCQHHCAKEWVPWAGQSRVESRARPTDSRPTVNRPVCPLPSVSRRLLAASLDDSVDGGP
jgi:hypothetical protein